MTTQSATSPSPATATISRPAVEAERLVKTYRGGVQALKGVTFSVRPGAVFALLGPNGAGKSTVVKILTTLSRPSTGRASIVDRRPRRRARASARAPRDRPRGAEVGGGPGGHGCREPHATGPDLRSLWRRAAATRLRSARALRVDGRAQAHRAHPLRWHAAQARRGYGPHPSAGGAVSGRANHWSGPGGARGHVARDRPTGARRWADRRADDALPRGGRSPGAARRHHRPRADRRRRDA